MPNPSHLFCLLISILAAQAVPAFSQPSTDVAVLKAVRPPQCDPAATQGRCDDFDAVVFVHGIGGDETTFTKDGFDWPAAMPTTISAAGKLTTIDVYRLNYSSTVARWASGTNPNFDDIVEAIIPALQPLREKRYRTIGFIAHSLGGNIMASYLHSIKAEFGHPQRSQHGFLIALGTPFNGAYMANIAQRVPFLHTLNPDLLESLEENNLYLRMLRRFSEKTRGKGKRYDCRPVPLYVAFEGPLASLFGIGIFVVTESSAANSIHVQIVDRANIKGFPLDHMQLAAPRSGDDEIAQWVMSKIENAYARVEGWPGERIHAKNAVVGDENYLCSRIPFIPE
jgi:pimeloyl-ACP methyl ester carboxylesterase